jgi:hypothetical protein
MNKSDGIIIRATLIFVCNTDDYPTSGDIALNCNPSFSEMAGQYNVTVAVDLNSSSFTPATIEAISQLEIRRQNDLIHVFNTTELEMVFYDELQAPVEGLVDHQYEVWHCHNGLTLLPAYL